MAHLQEMVPEILRLDDLWVRQLLLLLEGLPANTKVQQVRLACGYISFSTFCRDDRREFGCTASADLRRLP